MTLCIAAKCATCMGNTDPAIVLCADKRFETASAGADIGFKFEDLGQGWTAMISGRVDAAMELCTQYRNYLSDKEITDQNLLDVFTEPAKTRLDKTEAHLLGCDLLVCGFVEYRPHILWVDEEAQVTRRPHFATIGNGSSNADAMLHYREQHSSLPFVQTLYHVYEAKMFSANAPGVGPTTDVAFIPPDGVCRFLGNKGLSYLEDMRSTYGPQPTGDILDEQLHYSFIATWRERQDRVEPQG